MKPNCNQCKHFFITYNQHTPKGCRVFKIQSASMPSLVVKNVNNGGECLGFEAKKNKIKIK